MYKNVYFGKFGLLILLIIFLYISSKTFAQDVTETQNVEKNIETRNLSNYQKQIDKIEKDIEEIKEKLYQAKIEGYNQSIQTVNSLITWVGIVATIFAVIIAIGGFFIGWESIRSHQRREEAIETLEEAKSYVEKEIKEFENVKNMAVEQLSRDVEEFTRMVEEKKEKGLATEAERKIESLERRIKFFEEIGMPDDPKVLYSKAMLCKEKGMLQESLELLQKAIQRNPKYKSAYFQTGWIECKLGNYKEGIKAYDHVIKVDPENNPAYNNKGLALENLGRKNAALECYNKAIELAPKKSLYYRNKAKTLQDLERYEEALESINKSIDLDPSNNYDYSTAGRILSKMEKIKEAVKYYQKASEIEKEKVNKSDANEVDLLNYFENLLILKNYKEATELKSKIQNKIKSNEYIYIFDFLSSCLSFSKGKKTAGLKQISQIIENFERTSLEKVITWNFEDINPFLKLQLHENIYQTYITVEKLLLKEITPKECRSKIQKLKSEK